MSRVKFIDPAGDRDDYEWVINPSEQDEMGKTRNIEEGATTSGHGFVKQQSDDSPLVLSYQGTILEKAQVIELIQWWKLCEDQTIYFTDHKGDEFEVIITAFLPKEQRTVRNPRDFANAPFWYWTYTIKMEVIRVISGIWEGVTP